MRAVGRGNQLKIGQRKSFNAQFMGLLSFHASTPVCKQANVGVTITPFMSPVLGAGKEKQLI